MTTFCIGFYETYIFTGRGPKQYTISVTSFNIRYHNPSNPYKKIPNLIKPLKTITKNIPYSSPNQPYYNHVIPYQTMDNRKPKATTVTISSKAKKKMFSINLCSLIFQFSEIILVSIFLGSYCITQLHTITLLIDFRVKLDLIFSYMVDLT